MQDTHHEIYKEDVMKIINRNNVKAIFPKAALAGLVAAAAFMAAPQKANAQVAFGIQFGHPGYVARVPVYQQPYVERPYVETYNAGYYAPAPYGFDRRRDWERHEFEERRKRESREFRDHREWDRR